jgi:hypothetical protein
MMNNQVFVYLTGGFGNQMFQVVAAKSLNAEKIRLIKNVGRPRVNSEGNPEVLDVDCGIETEEFELKNNNKFIGKVFGYLLRSSITPTLIERLFFRKMMRIVGSLIINYELGTKVQIMYSDNVGYRKFERKRSNVLLVGYFQSYRFLEEARSNNQLINQSIFANRNITTSGTSRKKARLIIHYRLGDYKLDKAFGILSPDYYIRATKIVHQRMQIDEVWIFSDEIESAKRILGDELSTNVVWVNPKNHTTESSFELMRQGDAYIIGNSTYSWWAATLSHQEPQIVIAPSPWFAEMEEPRFLLPPQWQRIETEFINA